MIRGNIKRISLGLAGLMLAGMMGGCGSPSRHDAKATEKTALASEFAAYQEVPVSEQPTLTAYRVDADLGNVENADRFEFTDDARQRLAENGFVVLPGFHQEFFMLYEINRYDVIPNLVTTDAMLHNYHLFFQHLLKTVEQEELIPGMKQLNQLMVQASQEQLQSLKNTEWENAALRNLAFFTVGNRLMDSQAPIAEPVQNEVRAELKLIKEHNTTDISPVMSLGQPANLMESLKEDYTQYIPRSHYTYSPALRDYFQTMMWYGRMTFRLKNEDETRSAVLMSLALQDQERQSAWGNIYQTTSFFVGTSDDPGFIQYAEVIQGVYGADPSVTKLAEDKAKWQQFLQEARRIKAPAINSVPIFDARLQPDREKEISGFRFMGQRYTVDADIFQRLVYREVGENPQGERRLLPKGLDIPAALGSKEALSLLQDMGEYDYERYPDNMKKLNQYLSGVNDRIWQQNLYWSWMHALRPLTRQVPDGYPSFMLNQAWARKELNTFLGSWTELKHDTVLYAKQAYAEMGGGGVGEIDDRGYVEPNPHLYARLAALTALTRDGLQARNLLNERDQESLERMEKLALDLKTISEKELRGEELTEEEYELIRSFGGQLEHFWSEALRDQPGGRSQLLSNNPAMLVTDVATAPPDTVLQEATGCISQIYAVVPVAGGLRIAKGGIYSYYEFPWPAQNRLTDEKWRAMVYDRKTPDLPAWTRSFRVDQGECRVVMPWENE